MRRRTDFLLLGLGAVFATVSTVSAWALEIPYLSQRVTDQAQILDSGAESRLEDQLKQLETSTGAQVAVLTIPSLEGEVLEDYSLRVVEEWQLGRDDEDDGVLVLVARDDRKVRIEVGYGLEGAITDLQSKRIIDGLMVPEFRRGDFAAGIEAAVRAIGGAIRGEADAIPQPVSSARSDSSGGSDSVAIFFWLAISLFWIFSAFSKKGRRGGGGGWIIGSGGGGFSGGGFSGGGGSFGGGGASGSW